MIAAEARSWTFTRDDLDALVGCGDRFLKDSGAHSALLIERSGQLLAMVGQPPQFDPTSFATLAAADFSANDQLARLVGETDFRTLLHQGDTASIFAADVLGKVLLVALFDGGTTTGMVRLAAEKARQELALVFGDIFSRGSPDGDRSSPGVLAGAEDEIDRMFDP